MENWWLKTMDKKIKIWQVNWTEQMELNRISFNNIVIFNNKNFQLYLLTDATFLLQHICHYLKKLRDS